MELAPQAALVHLAIMIAMQICLMAVKPMVPAVLPRMVDGVRGVLGVLVVRVLAAPQEHKVQQLPAPIRALAVVEALALVLLEQPVLMSVGYILQQNHKAAARDLAQLVATTTAKNAPLLLPVDGVKPLQLIADMEARLGQLAGVHALG